MTRQHIRHSLTAIVMPAGRVTKDKYTVWLERRGVPTLTYLIASTLQSIKLPNGFSGILLSPAFTFEHLKDQLKVENIEIEAEAAIDCNCHGLEDGMHCSWAKVWMCLVFHLKSGNKEVKHVNRRLQGQKLSSCSLGSSVTINATGPKQLHLACSFELWPLVQALVFTKMGNSMRMDDSNRPCYSTCQWGKHLCWGGKKCGEWTMAKQYSRAAKWSIIMPCLVGKAWCWSKIQVLQPDLCLLDSTLIRLLAVKSRFVTEFSKPKMEWSY